LIGVIRWGLGSYLKDSDIPDIHEVAYFNELLHDAALGDEITKVEVDVYYYTVTDPFEIRMWTYSGTLMELLEKVDGFYPEKVRAL
jgi:hypothetical protein